jgi:hypothetical protein
MAMAAMNMVSAVGFLRVSFQLRTFPQGVASVLCKKTPIFGSRRSKLDHLTVVTTTDSRFRNESWIPSLSHVREHICDALRGAVAVWTLTSRAFSSTTGKSLSRTRWDRDSDTNKLRPTNFGTFWPLLSHCFNTARMTSSPSSGERAGGRIV